MDPDKFSRIQLFLHRAQSLADHPRSFAGVKMNVFIVRLEPVDFPGLKKSDPSVGANDNAIQILLLGANAIEQRAYLELFLFMMLGMETFLGVFQRGLEPHLVERF